MERPEDQLNSEYPSACRKGCWEPLSPAQRYLILSREKIKNLEIVISIHEYDTDQFSLRSFALKKDYLSNSSYFIVTSITPTQLSDRTDTRLYQMFFVWFSANFNILAFSTGSAAPAFFNLGLKHTAIIVVVVNFM